MQQLFSKETFIHTTTGPRSGEDGIGGRRLEQDTWLAEKQPSNSRIPTCQLRTFSQKQSLQQWASSALARGSSSVFPHTDGRDHRALATAMQLTHLFAGTYFKLIHFFVSKSDTIPFFVIAVSFRPLGRQ